MVVQKADNSDDAKVVSLDTRKVGQKENRLVAELVAHLAVRKVH